METKICSKLDWLRPYLYCGKRFISQNRKISRIGAWTFGKSKGANYHACVYQDRDGDPYRIWLHTHYEDSDGKVVRFSKIDILRLLAHEMAHVEEWNHTPRHASIEAKIHMAFMKMLQDDGYISEEAELNE